MELFEWLVVAYALVAMIMDLTRRRISNWYLIFGWAAGAAIQFFDSSPIRWLNYLGGSLLPIILLYIFFYYRMMGAGDVKLLSVLGGMTGLAMVFPLILFSFLAGGIISIGIMTYRRSWSKRFRFFYRYFYNYRMTGIRVPYRAEEGCKDVLHFAVSVFCAVLAWKGGLI